MLSFFPSLPVKQFPEIGHLIHIYYTFRFKPSPVWLTVHMRPIFTHLAWPDSPALRSHLGCQTLGQQLNSERTEATRSSDGACRSNPWMATTSLPLISSPEALQAVETVNYSDRISWNYGEQTEPRDKHPPSIPSHTREGSCQPMPDLNIFILQLMKGKRIHLHGEWVTDKTSGQDKNPMQFLYNIKVW